MSNQPASEHVEPRVWSARLVDWFFRNTQVVILLFLALVGSGIWAVMTLRSEGFPAPQVNIIVVSTLYKGASPQEVENQIVKPIEGAVQGIKGVGDVNSTAANSFGNILVSVDAGADFNSVIGEVRNKVQAVTLPADADKPQISNPSFGGSISYYALTGAVADPTVLRRQGDFISRSMETVAGVKEFKLVQPVNDKVLVSFRPADIAKYNINLAVINQALAGSNITIPAGSLDLSGRSVSTVTVAPLTSIEDIQNLVIGSDSSGGTPVPVQLKQVAGVSLVNENKALLDQYVSRSAAGATATSSPALYYQLVYKDNADVVKSSAKVEERIAELREAQELKGAQLETVFNIATSIDDQVKEIEHGAIGTPIGEGPFSKAGYLLGAIWLIFLSMLVFVSWRASLISVLAIPLSLLFAMFALKIQGVSLNTLTLFSVVLVLALIVDPAIVLLEAIQRELDLGRTGRNAVIAAMNTVGTGAFIAVICNILVFVPFAIVGGVFGQIIRYIPMTVIPALIASYFVPLIFLNYLGRSFLKPSKTHADDEEIANLWKVGQWFVRTNTYILRRGWLQGIIILAAITVPLGITGLLFATGKVVPVQFSATPDNPSYQVDIEYPANLVTDTKSQLVQRVSLALRDEPTTRNFFTLMQGDTGLSLQVQLFPRKDRTENSTAIVERLNAELASLGKPGERIFVTALSQGTTGPQPDPVSVNIYGDDLQTLRKAAIQTGDILRQQAKVTRVSDGFTGENNPQVAVVIDRTKLAQAGVPPIVIAQVLSGYVGETSVTKYEQTVAGASRQVEVFLVNASKPTNLTSLGQLVVGVGPQGTPLTVKEVATVSETKGFKGIQRLNGQRYVTVSAKVEDALKDAAAPQKAVKEYWSADKLQAFGLRKDALDSRGAGDEFLKSFRDLFLALGAACFLLYVVLVFFFRSFAQPFIILFAVPLSFVGVFPALSLAGGQFGFLEILGIITLAGIVVNVGIFLIDLANQRRALGMDYRDAIAEASGIRFRPIFLTKVVALGGMLPLIVLSPFWRSLAVVVLAGVLVSGFLSLFTTPILYTWFITMGNWFGRKLTRSR